MTNNIDKVKKIRDITLSPVNKINLALDKCNGDLDKAIELLIKEKQTISIDIANRTADNNFVYSYVHNNKIGAMIVLSCQTDFVARNELFLELAKNICLHIVSNPIHAEYVNLSDISAEEQCHQALIFKAEIKGKPPEIIDKIVVGKINKYFGDKCLLNQKFIKDDKITIEGLINQVSASVGEKIQISKFVRMVG